MHVHYTDGNFDGHDYDYLTIMTMIRTLMIIIEKYRGGRAL